MNATFTVQVEHFQKINKITHAWSNEDYHALMAIMDLDEGLAGMDATELREMCMMSLNDLDHDEAAKVILTHLFPDESPGKIEQISHDMIDNRLWEQYSNCLYHQRFFSAYALLREAFNGIFAQPTGVEISVKITGENSEDMAIFDQSVHSSLVRLLANGQGDDALIHRLYDTQIQGKQFPEAPGIIWQLEQLSDSGLTRQFSFVSSYFWFERIEHIDDFTALSHGDVSSDDT
ncbi:MAG: hypothetical protein ACI9C4_003169 [Paraglaciecola sp.]|jgi:hypothetical protein